MRGSADLLARLARRPLAAWAVAAACVSALFGTMAGSITDLLEPGSPTAQMVDKMADGSPVSQFMGLLTVFTVLLVVVAAVGRAGALAGDERRGLVEAEAAAGVCRTRLFVVQAGAAVIEAAILLLVSGGVTYTVGGVVYARRWPDPDPRWFGFHEIFHTCTVAAWACQCTACYLAVLG
mgnify:CR=1 FL=1